MKGCRVLTAALAAAFVMTVGNVHGSLWKCIQPDGTLLFQEGAGPGCREVRVSSTLQSIRFPGSQGSGEDRPAPGPVNAAPLSGTSGVGGRQGLSSRPFLPVSRIVPAVSYHDLSPDLRAKGWNIPNKGDIQLLQVDVSHLPSGDGPSLSTDHHFMNEARQALGTAVLAAAKATGYDPRFLRVRLTMPMVAGSFFRGVHVDGASAGAVWAVAVTSAILGDEVRRDLCFSGTIDITLTVGPVDGLEHKIEGCRLLPQFRELMVPAGQKTFTLTDKGKAQSIKVTEVSTLAEAYEIATGRPLRPAQ